MRNLNRLGHAPDRLVRGELLEHLRLLARIMLLEVAVDEWRVHARPQWLSKQAAFTYGCAEKGSVLLQQIFPLLLSKVRSASN